ncbi:LrgB family protein [Evansella sp. AB-P1]|uniref:LrgB family protein n=1 Tax=Evansella sp. AB-P1 TaxID=3037653 RepID=UPI00241EBB89|nr:LrgB family protein [Evansella sp. AB-P1]MDG5786752.1 LrgB family protein [Evansella sp. AB-P1]
MSIVVTLLSIIGTVTAYLLSRKIANKKPSPFTTPVFLSTVLIILVMVMTGTSYGQYEQAKDIMTYLLGPATVALAVPIYKNRHLIVQYCVPAGTGLILGSIVTIFLSILIGGLFQLSEVLISSLAVKSATVPIAIEISHIINGDMSITAAFVIITGILGAMLGPWLLTKTNITNPVARGLAVGTISHGIGTAEIAREGELQGAVSGTAMAIAAIFTSIFVPLL